jgi:hypothetical protein
MHDDWWVLLTCSLLLGGIGLYLGRSTRPGKWRQGDLLYLLRRYVQIGGWMLTIIGVLTAIHVALMLGFIPP